MKRKLIAGSITGGLFGIVGMANTHLIGGVQFPDGAVSFADAVYSYNPG